MITVDDITPIGSRLLVKKYKKPEKVGSLYVNPAWQVDNSRALWEVIKSSPKADEYIGFAVQPDWILITLPNRGIVLDGIWTEDNDEVYALFAEEIVKWIPKTWE